ncbi:hypothetical protein B0T26DRAFT_671551 [Lasiosphaeria miniovina]|uniref:F-box domain-containing protein n=1 Tax=Lasiosphaeria miniovina TaxID=1954250 RepID=A0AA40E8Y5_9PEZI|nr:uncharacterized protein B0T26DRAFT_671551 [Lasiosphaeria miniovina]KAK0726798.1 hypothetical protein B0T26DRAFT_671551 [Lasiosphaeria miniovina]
MAVSISPARLGTPWPRSKSTNSLASLALSKSPPPKPAPKQTSFLDLPYEIRTMIYANYLPSRRSTSQKTTQTLDRLARDLAKGYLYRSHAGKWSARIKSPYHFVRNLLLVSRQIYDEVLAEVLNRFRILIPNIFELGSTGRPARELEAVCMDFCKKGQAIRHLEVDVNPRHVPAVPVSTSRCGGSGAVVVRNARPGQEPSQELNFDLINDLDLNKDIWDRLLSGLASITIKVSLARLPEEWAEKILAILRYVDASVTERCVVEVHATYKQDRELIEAAMRHPRLRIVVQAEEEEEWFELNGSAD